MSINKSQTILDVGQRLTQTRGYNAFSYADIAEQVRIRKASIHYYYPSKADLGRKLVMRYRRVMRQRLQAIEAQSTYPVEPLRGLVTIFREALQEDSLCLGSMLSAEYITLPGTVQTEVQGYFADMETWVAQVIQSGQESGYFGHVKDAKTSARSLLAGLQGAQMGCRMVPDRFIRFDAIAAHLLQPFED